MAEDGHRTIESRVLFGAAQPLCGRAGLLGSGRDLRHGRPRRGNPTPSRSCRMPRPLAISIGIRLPVALRPS